MAVAYDASKLSETVFNVVLLKRRVSLKLHAVYNQQARCCSYADLFGTCASFRARSGILGEYECNWKL